MSDAIVQRSSTFEAPSEKAARKPIPMGYGLLTGAVISLGLWAGLVWSGLKLLS